VLRRADESASAPRRGLRDLDYLANLLAAGDSEVVRGVLRRLAAMRGHMRKRAVLGEHDHEMPAAVTMSVEDVVLTEQSTELDIIQMLGEQRQAARWHHRLCPRVGHGPETPSGTVGHGLGRPPIRDSGQSPSAVRLAHAIDAGEACRGS
jgi:hypothetical protein